MAKNKKNFNINDDINLEHNEETTSINLEALETTNIGMKKPDPSTHSNIAQISDTDEVEQRKAQYEKLEKRKKLGIKKFSNDNEDDIMLDDTIISKELIEQSSRSNKVARFEPSIEYGLNEQQIQQRIEEGMVNDNQKQYSKTYSQIFLNNILTFFNVLCFAVAAALIYVKEYKNLTFMIILLCNTVIGIVQEIKAKKTIDKLSIVTAPTATVIREAITKEIQVKELVLDDIVRFKNGKQISADCIILNGEIEVNESLLTGESVAVKKGPGDTLYAGSFITSGTCVAKVNRVGQDCYIQKLQAKAKRYTKPKSELLRSLKLITTFITIVIIPLGTIVGFRNYESAEASVRSSTFGTSGSVMVYGIDSQGGEHEIADLAKDEKISITQSDSKFTLSASNLPEISRLKIEYTNKASGNLSISAIKLYEAIENSSGVVTPSELPAKEWTFNKDNKNTSFINLISQHDAGQYEDGTVKLDSSSSYIITSSFAKKTAFFLEITLQSRGYGYDDTPEEDKIVQDQIVRLTVTKTAGSLIGMIPAGLFLLVTIALAVSVVKLAKSKTLVQELYCIEMLARVDCICLDKTGTITDGTMKVKDIIDIAPLDPKEPKVDTIIGAMIGALEDNNLTSIALQDRFGVNFEFKKLAAVPFSSARKLSAVTFEDKGTYILGAPEFVYQGKSKKIAAIVAKKAAMGYRVLMLAKSEKAIVDGKVPTNCNPLALITLEDHIREEAYDTIKWFKDNGVQVKVISGDNPATVAEIAGKVGIDGASDYISLDGLSPQEVETIANEYTVFGRVSPDQKAILIRTLKRHGKTVAMTGDGVNDILAMKESDCSVAMASGSDAARNVAHLVLLDSNFANMPKVVLEGRRVINNIQSSASLYLMKTLFVMVITFLSIVAKNIFKAGYPFEPVQFMMLEFFIIGLPSTILALQPNKEKIKGNFIINMLSNCIVQAFCLILTVLMIYLLANKDIPGLDLSNYAEANSICVLAITYVGVIILFNVCRPFNTLRAVVWLFSAVCISLAFLIPEIATNIGIAYLLSDLSITNQLFTIVVILAIVPIETGLSELVRMFKEKSKNKNVETR